MSGSVGAMLGLWESGTDHIRAFANFRDTFKPAAFDFSLAENEGVLDPETSRSYEGGLKIRAMEGRVDVEASAFRMDFENLVTATVVNNLPALINAGTTRFQGFEVATDLRLERSVYLRGSYSYHDGKFVDFVQAFDGVPTQLAGKRFEMSARKLASAGIVLAPEKGFTSYANLNYTGDRYLNKRNTALVPGFSTFDLGIGYRTDRAEFRARRPQPRRSSRCGLRERVRRRAVLSDDADEHSGGGGGEVLGLSSRAKRGIWQPEAALTRRGPDPSLCSG